MQEHQRAGQWRQKFSLCLPGWRGSGCTPAWHVYVQFHSGIDPAARKHTPPVDIRSSALVFCPFLIGTLAGFGAAATMVVVGVSSLVWLYRGLRGSVGAGGSVGERLVVLSEKAKEQGKEWAASPQQKVQENSSDSLIHRG